MPTKMENRPHVTGVVESYKTPPFGGEYLAAIGSVVMAAGVKTFCSAESGGVPCIVVDDAQEVASLQRVPNEGILPQHD